MKAFIYTELNTGLQTQLSGRLSGQEVFFRNPKESSAPVEFRSAELLLGNPPLAWMNQADQLRFWQLDSAGFDQYRELNAQFVVANMGDFFAAKCAETMVGGILAFYRNIHRLVQLQAEKKWIGKPLRYEMDLLTGKRVIIFGAGTIARCIKKMLTGFDCEVTFAARKDPDAEIHSREELTARLPEADLVINTLPGVADKYADKTVFAAMKNGALYASVGRGNTTDEKALIHALTSHHLAGAVLDVTEKEPLPAESPLWQMPNVILTQHTAGGHRFEDEFKIDLFVSNVKRFIDGQKPVNLVNIGEGY